MNIGEMHLRFRVNYDKIDSFSAPEYTPEAVDVLLNQAQEDLIKLCTEKGIESSQTIIDYLGNIIKREEITTFFTDSLNEPNGVYVALPLDYRKAIMEKAIIKYANCAQIKSGKIQVKEYIVSENPITYIGQTYSPGQTFMGVQGYTTYTGSGIIYESITGFAIIIPTTRDRYLRSIENPFKKPNSEEIFRFEIQKINSSTSPVYELISSPEVPIISYRIDYIRNPQKMVYGTRYSPPLANDTDCELSEEAQIRIIDLAVTEALKIVGDQRFQENKQETVQQPN